MKQIAQIGRYRIQVSNILGNKFTGAIMKFSSKSTLKALSISLVVLSSLSLVAGSAFADDNAVVCAALAPCALDGSVLPEFQNGPCASTYADTCALPSESTVLVPLTRSDSVRAEMCQKTLRQTRKSQSNLSVVNAKLRAENAKLRSQLNALLKP